MDPIKLFYPDPRAPQRGWNRVGEVWLVEDPSRSSTKRDKRLAKKLGPTNSKAEH
jgi:hypothetical protein